jgi:hypothetical protein
MLVTGSLLDVNGGLKEGLGVISGARGCGGD